MKQWIIDTPDEEQIARLSHQTGLSPLCCRVLSARGYSDPSRCASLLSCEKLSDPFLLADMHEAVEAINQAMDVGKRICVYGDYDCDGVMATTILYSFLADIGADVCWRLPERAEGYGLNCNAIRELHDQGVGLIITVDNGIAAIDEAEYIAELGIDLVVTDHHRVGDTLPKALAVVDAHREDNTSPYRDYCGAGIALLLVAALSDGDTHMAMEQFGDLACIATIADIVPLTGENRYIVEMGLQYLENTERVGLMALREVSGLTDKALGSSQIAFGYAPRINAVGRMASPRLAVELLLAEDSTSAKERSDALQACNTKRMEVEQTILTEAKKTLLQHPERLRDRVLVLEGEGWDRGVIGICAARLQEELGKPCMMISVIDGVGVGSARSFGAFSIFEVLTACRDLLDKFGGHPAAGGFTIQAEKIAAFRQAVAKYAASEHPDMPYAQIHAVCELTPALLQLDSVESLEALQPFGAENPEPVFCLQNAIISGIYPLSEGKHTRLKLTAKGIDYTAMLFRRSPDSLGLSVGDTVHVMAQLQVNSFHGKRSVQLLAKDIRPTGLSQAKLLAAQRSYEAYCRGEALPQGYYEALCPSREDCVRVYKAIPSQGISVDRLCATLFSAMNAAKVRLSLDAFVELGLMEYRELQAFVIPTQVSIKVDLGQSRILQVIEQKARGKA